MSSTPSTSAAPNTQAAAPSAESSPSAKPQDVAPQSSAVPSAPSAAPTETQQTSTTPAATDKTAPAATAEAATTANAKDTASQGSKEGSHAATAAPSPTTPPTASTTAPAASAAPTSSSAAPAAVTATANDSTKIELLNPSADKSKSKDQEATLATRPAAKSKNKFPSITKETPKLIGDEPAPKRLTPSGGYYIECFLREVITNIRRNPMMSVASISTVMVLALILGLFIAMVANLDCLANHLAGEMQIKVYMDSHFSTNQVEEFEQQVLGLEHVAKVTFIPKDEAFARLREKLNTDISLEDLEENPLPDAFEVPVDDPQYLDQVAHRLSILTGVDTVDYGREEASKLLKLNKIVRLVGFIILALLLASTVLIVSNTIRLTVFARRKEIDIMQLVGAADWFIRWPFILEGVAQGFIGAGMAALTLDFSYRLVVPQVQRSITFLPLMPPNSLMPFLCVGLVVMGCLVGAIGSWISVNRYLNA